MIVLRLMMPREPVAVLGEGGAQEIDRFGVGAFGFEGAGVEDGVDGACIKNNTEASVPFTDSRPLFSMRSAPVVVSKMDKLRLLLNVNQHLIAAGTASVGQARLQAKKPGLMFRDQLANLSTASSSSSSSP